METIDERSLKEKIEEAKFNCSKWFNEKKEWAIKNKEVVVIMVPIIAEGVISITKEILKHGRLKEERRLKENFIYDRSHGHYNELRRPMKQSEWREYDRRRDNGESTSDILRDMRLSK